MKVWSPADIIRLLEMPFEDIRPFKRQLATEVPARALIAALNEATRARTRWLLCDVLGMQRDPVAAPTLLTCLGDESATMRAIAADGLGKLGLPEAGESLLKHFSNPEEDAGVRRTAGAALGAVGHRPAIPALISALKESDAGIRASAALALGLLRAEEAIDPLKAALDVETEWYPQRRMTDALTLIEEH